MEHDISELVEIQHRIADREDKPMNEPWMYARECAEAYAEHMAIDLIERIKAWEQRNYRMIGALTAENLIKHLYREIKE